MRTHTKRTRKPVERRTRRTADQRKADHRSTLDHLTTVVASVRNAEQDGLLYSGSIRLANRRIPWLQVGPGVMALWWPYTESPHVVLLRDVPCTLKIQIVDWTDDDVVLISYRGRPVRVAQWINNVFRRVYNCKPGYTIESELSDLTA